MKKKVLLIYADLGWSGSYVIQAPISLVYVATELVKMPDVEIDIVDCRLEKDWRGLVKKKVEEDNIILVGFSVMSGYQVYTTFEATCLIKDLKDIPIVWGGPHCTILPEQVLSYGQIDYCVRGFGVDAMKAIVDKVLGNPSDLDAIVGLCYKKEDGSDHISGINDKYERIGFKELPYQLLDDVIERYFDNQENREFPIYTSFGCPYLCNFCISPIWFEDTNKKWDPLESSEVADHIEYLMNRWNVDFIYFWDDDTFVRPSHFIGIAKEIIQRNIRVKIGVRGIRVNEVNRFKEKDFDLLNAVGVKYLHIGVESGSQKVLDLMKKGIKVTDSLAMNKSMKNFPQITAMYNMLCGIPSETLDDLKDTGEFMIQLSEDNPNCIMFDPCKLVPYPGCESYEMSVKYGFVPPNTPDDWKNFDKDGDIYHPWYTPEYDRYIKLLQMASFALSNWGKYLEPRPQWIQFLFKISKTIYLPVAKYRIRSLNTSFFIEYPLFRMLKKLMVLMAPSKQ